MEGNQKRSSAKPVAAVVTTLILASAGLMQLVEKWESGSRRVLTVYADKLASGLPTVCNGLTRHVTTTPIIVGQKWTNEKCEAEERRAMIVHVQQPLLKCFTRKPPQSVFDAASSLAWNVGAGPVCRSQSMRLWNRGEWSLGCVRIAYTPSYQPNWSKAGGRHVPGLHNRRKDEMKQCLAGIGDKS